MTDIYDEGLRQFRICNACRYCEGYCAVWDAMERKPDLLSSDLKYYSNLCHDCRDCYYVCPYTGEHEFQINIPRVLSQIRIETYGENIVPKRLFPLVKRPYLSWGIVLLFCLAFTFFLAVDVEGPSVLVRPASIGAAVIPDLYFKMLSIILYSYVLVMWAIEGSRYWDSIKVQDMKVVSKDVTGAVSDAFSHRYFRGGQSGCSYPRESVSSVRMIAHMGVLFGFILDLFTIAFYPGLTAGLVWLYIIGAAGMSVGSLLLLTTKSVSNQELASDSMKSYDYPFTMTIFITGITGVIFPVVSGTSLYSGFFLVHVALVAGIYLMAPFSKFIHPVFRFLSLLRNRMESRMELASS